MDLTIRIWFNNGLTIITQNSGFNMILTIRIWGLKSKHGDSTIELCLEAANYGAFMVLKPGKTRMTWRISWEYHGHTLW